MATKLTRVGYWVSTLLFSLALGWSAVQYLTEAPKMVETMAHLGYPLYFVKALGVAKLLGMAALLVGWPRLKEWAYAGFTFDLVGACVSHLSSGDGIAIAAVPFGFMVLLAISYLTWRRLDARAVAYHGAPHEHDPHVLRPAH